MRYYRLFLAIFLILTVSACSKSMMTIKSNPPGAQAVLEKYGISLMTDGKVELPENEIFGEKDSTSENLIVTKEGYKTYKKSIWLFKGKKNEIPVVLEEYNTFLEIKSTPAPIHIKFSPDAPLPEDWPREFTTPVSLKCTEKEAKALTSHHLMVDFQSINGFLPTGNYRSLISNTGYALGSSLQPGHKNIMDISLKPVVTTLQVISKPDQAIVTDLSSGGFLTMGETNFIKSFNWEDVVLWSNRISASSEVDGSENEATGRSRKSLYRSSLYLNLKLSKPGYQDLFVKRVRIPIGEERILNVTLNPLISKIHFDSEPEHVHVYVQRMMEKDIYNEKKEIFEKVLVEHKKHLGRTPFHLSVDPNDPLIHGETLIFEKSGYKPSKVKFADGEASFFKVMVPEHIKER